MMSGLHTDVQLVKRVQRKFERLEKQCSERYQLREAKVIQEIIEIMSPLIFLIMTTYQSLSVCKTVYNQRFRISKRKIVLFVIFNTLCTGDWCMAQKSEVVILTISHSNNWASPMTQHAQLEHTFTLLLINYVMKLLSLIEQ